MFRHALLSIVTLSGVALGSASAQAQAAAPAPAQTVAANSDDRAAKVQRLVDGACGPAPAASAPASDRSIFADCQTVAKARAEAMVH